MTNQQPSFVGKNDPTSTMFGNPISANDNLGHLQVRAHRNS